MLVVLFTIVASGCATRIPLSDSFTISPNSVTGHKLPLSVGLFIDAETKNFKESVKPSASLNLASAATYELPIGENLAKIILGASEASFEKVEAVDALPKSSSKTMNAYITVQDLKANTQVGFRNTAAMMFGVVGALANVYRTESNSSMSVSVRIVDSNLNEICFFDVSGQGESDAKGMATKYFAGGVNIAMQDLAENMLKEISNSPQMKNYAEKVRLQKS